MKSKPDNNNRDKCESNAKKTLQYNKFSVLMQSHTTTKHTLLYTGVDKLLQILHFLLPCKIKIMKLAQAN